MKEGNVDAAFAAYLEIFTDWLAIHFNGLKSYYGWQTFYGYLVKMYVEIINAKETKGENKIKFENVVLPRWRDLCQWCRLLYQGIVPLRIAVIDGQHRMCAMVKMLTGWEVFVDESTIPPKRFVQFGTDYSSEEDFFKVWMAITKTMPTVCTLVAEDSNKMEVYAKRYSKERETSQTSKKQRNLVDV